MLVGRMNSDLKTCRDCHAEKPETAFAIHSASGRRRGQCEPCRRGKDRETAQRNRVVPEQKTCPTCLRALPATAFPTSPNTKTGLFSRCRECCRTIDRQRNATEKRRASSAASRERNREAKRARDRAIYAASPEKYKARRRAHYRRDPARNNANVAKWKAANHDRVVAYGEKRRAAKMGAAGGVTADEWAAIQTDFGHRCAYCLRQDGRLTQDHMIPLSRGGKHCVANIVPACRSCNPRKGASTPLEWLARGR